MPEISRFFGIIIVMFHNEHNPPHFHVRYQGQRAVISIKKLSLMEGKLSPKILTLVIEWATKHQKELLKNWELAEKLLLPNPIEPLE